MHFSFDNNLERNISKLYCTKIKQQKYIDQHKIRIARKIGSLLRSITYEPNKLQRTLKQQCIAKTFNFVETH